MKINSLLFLLLMILPFTAPAQEGLGDLFKQVGEDFGKENALGSQPENNRSQNQNNAPSPEDRARMDQWKEMFEAMTADMSEAMKYFNTPETKCVFAMVIYLDAYMDLLDTIEATDDLDCHIKYDAYGLQAMAIATSTTIINCPESLYKLNQQEKDILGDDLLIIHNAENESQALKLWFRKYVRVVHYWGFGGETMNEVIEDLVRFFTPIYVIKELMLIRQRMEALPCGD